MPVRPFHTYIRFMILITDLPPEMRTQLLKERRQARKAAEVFARVCREGDAENLYNAHLLLNECFDAWRPAMAKVAKLPRVSPEIQCAFLNIWIESKMLPLRVGHRPTMAAALRMLMPGNYSGLPLVLYRGASGNERRRRYYGFSWSTDIDLARPFAENWAQPMPANYTGAPCEGVILQTVAPPESVLLIRKPEDYYDEGEVIVDPYKIGKVEVVERLGPVNKVELESTSKHRICALRA
jgi:hypothetical protein